MAAVVQVSPSDVDVADCPTSGGFPVQGALELLAAARRSGDAFAQRQCEVAVAEQFRPLADRIARRYRGRGVEGDDLQQLARLALWKAIRRWRPQLNPTLVQFAGPTIEGEIKRYFRDHCRPIRMPRPLQEDLVAHRAACQELAQALGREPTEQEIAAAAGTSVSRLRRQRQASRICQPVSADTPFGSLAAGIRCEASTRSLNMVDDVLSLGAAIRRLPPRDRHLLGLRFVREMSQKEIAERIGVSQMQVSRMLRSVLGRLRSQLAY